MKKIIFFAFFLHNNIMALDPTAIVVGSLLSICGITRNCWKACCCQLLKNYGDPLSEKCANHCTRKDVTCMCICRTCKKAFKPNNLITEEPTVSNINANLRKYVLVNPKGPESERPRIRRKRF